MQRIVRELPANCEIISGSCTHIGSIMCHYEGLDKLKAHILEKENRFFIHLGDVIEAIAIDDKRYNPPPPYLNTEKKETPIPLLQAREAMYILLPISDRIITILRGNHERKLLKFGDLIQTSICDVLGIPFGTECCRIIITNGGKPVFNIFAMHGHKIFKSNAKDPEQREANKKASLKLYLQHQMGDCAVMVCGHAHWIGIVPPSKRLYFMDGVDGVHQKYLKGQTSVGEYIDVDRRWYACCGSARKSRLDGYDDYAQYYEANELGFVKIVVKSGKVVRVEPFYI